MSATRDCVHGSLARSCELCFLLRHIESLTEVLRTTASNIRSQQAAHPGVRIYDKWLEVVEQAIDGAPQGGGR